MIRTVTIFALALIMGRSAPHAQEADSTRPAMPVDSAEALTPGDTSSLGDRPDTSLIPALDDTSAVGFPGLDSLADDELTFEERYQDFKQAHLERGPSLSTSTVPLPTSPPTGSTLMNSASALCTTMPATIFASTHPT